MTKYHFAFVSSYQGDSDYYVYNRDTGQRSRISLRLTLLDCVAETCASQEIFDREIVPTVGVVRGDKYTVTPDMLAAFHAWRVARYAPSIPERCRGAYWSDGGWIFVDPS